MKEARKNHYHRHPRTMNERRISQDKFDLLIRAKRRCGNIPNSYWDINKNEEKSWKKRRKTRYHEDKSDWTWYFRDYRYYDEDLVERIKARGYFYEWVGGGIKWFGKEI